MWHVLFAAEVQVLVVLQYQNQDGEMHGAVQGLPVGLEVLHRPGRAT